MRAQRIVALRVETSDRTEVVSDGIVLFEEKTKDESDISDVDDDGVILKEDGEDDSDNEEDE